MAPPDTFVVRVKPHVADDSHRLCRKGLVQLDGVDVVKSHSNLVEHCRDGYGDRPPRNDQLPRSVQALVHVDRAQPTHCLNDPVFDENIARESWADVTTRPPDTRVRTLTSFRTLLMAAG